MLYTDFLTALNEARNRANLAGRPLSQQETAAVSGPYLHNMAGRELQGQALNFSEQHHNDELALANWKLARQQETAKLASRNQLLSNILNTGGTLAAYKYYR